MKCIKFGSEVKRVKDQEAKVLVSRGSWAYCSKELWKKSRLPVDETKTETVVKNTSKKDKKAKTEAEKIADKIAEPIKEVTAADIMNQANFMQPTVVTTDDKKSKKTKKPQKK